jgi:hypothetical protein
MPVDRDVKLNQYLSWQKGTNGFTGGRSKSSPRQTFPGKFGRQSLDLELYAYTSEKKVLPIKGWGSLEEGQGFAIPGPLPQRKKFLF